MRDSPDTFYWSDENALQRMRDRDELMRLRDLGYQINIQHSSGHKYGWVDIPVELERAREWAKRTVMP